MRRGRRAVRLHHGQAASGCLPVERRGTACLPAHLSEAVGDPRQRQVALDKAAGGAHQQGVPLLNAVGALGQQGYAEKHGQREGGELEADNVRLPEGSMQCQELNTAAQAAHPTPARGSKSPAAPARARCLRRRPAGLQALA